MYKLLLSAFVLFATSPAIHSPAFARAMEAGDAAIARQATQAVVNISTWKVRPPTKPGESPRRVKVYASGFIIDPTGIIVTNKHVIDGAMNLKVTFSDGSHASTRLLAAAAMVDLALLKVDVDRPLPTLKWGDSDALQVGDPVLTFGNQLGIGLSVSAGIVSGLNRDLQDSPFDSYIQTDATINHGNSGGPLVNLAGETVGVDTALLNPDENGGFIGVGFAIPSNTAKFIVQQLLDPRHPKPGWLGASLQDMTDELAVALGLPQATGAIISAVDASGPASQASLRPGDVLEKIDGEQQGDSRAFNRAVVMMQVGKQAHLTVWRDGKQQDITVTVAEWPNYMPNGGMVTTQTAQAMIARMPDPGFKLAPISDALRKQYSLDATLTGALVSEVERDCEASDLGIAPGDVITAVQAGPVTTPDDVTRAVQVAHQEHRAYLAVLIQAKNGARWVSLSIGGASS